MPPFNEEWHSRRRRLRTMGKRREGQAPNYPYDTKKIGVVQNECYYSIEKYIKGATWGVMMAFWPPNGASVRCPIRHAPRAPPK